MAVTSLEFLKSEINGVEFFTIVSTGESAVSVRGLSKMSGVPNQTISRWFSDLPHESTPGWLKSLQGMPLDLPHEFTKKGKKIKPVPAKTASKFISLVARHLGKDQAFETLDAIAEIGLTSYIQTQTGWLPERYTSAPESHRSIDRILNEAAPWEIFFDPKFCRPFFGGFGGSGYWKFVYSWMTAEEKAKINQLNPPQNGIRRHKIHQFLPEEIRDRLAPHVVRLDAFMGLSRGSKDKFRALCNEFYGDGWQLEMDLT